MRLLYIHAYQSFIWNKVASRRLKEWGHTLRVGDLVFADRTKAEENAEKEQVIVDEENINQIDETTEEEAECGGEDETEVGEEEIISEFKALARPLTEDDLSSGEYTIFDLVLPLPGHDILYPSNETKIWYEEYLAEDELSSEKLKQKIKLYSLTGAYRRVVIKPEGLSWKLVKYNTPEDNLIRSDFEEIKNINVVDGIGKC